MKFFILASAILVSGCSTVVPVTQKWPEPPGIQSMEPCNELQKLSSNPKLSDVARTVTSNYNTYYSCAVKVEAWQEWYATQQIIFKGLK